MLIWAVLLSVCLASTDPEPFHHDLDDSVISCGVNFACVLEDVAAVSVGGEAVCWGPGAAGFEVPPGAFLQLSAGGRHACGIAVTEAVVCWGDGGRDAVVDYTPREGRYFQVSVGELHACAVDSEGAIVCWGKWKERGAL